MRDAGVDSWIAKPVAAGTALVVGGLEGFVPNPFKGNPVFGQGVRKAVSSYLASVLRQYPGELSEEFLQSVVSGAGETAATYMDTNAPDVPFDGKAFKKALSETVQAAGPLAILMGVPAAAQLPGVVANEMQQQAPAPVVAPPAEQAPPPVQAPPVAPEPTPPAPVVRDESEAPDVMGPPEAPPSRAMQITKAIEKMGQVMDPVTGRPTGEVRRDCGQRVRQRRQQRLEFGERLLRLVLRVVTQVVFEAAVSVPVCDRIA